MSSLAELILKVTGRAESDPDAVLPVLRLLADPEQEPTAHPDVHQAALRVNTVRLAEQERRFREGGLGTAQVRPLLHTTRQAINERVATGSLLAAKVGSRWLFPGWQFSSTGYTPGLRDVITALMGTTGRDVRQADAIMRASQPDLAERTLADLLADGQTAEVVRRIVMRADQS